MRDPTPGTWLPGMAVGRKGLCLRAVQAGLAFAQTPEWWPELAPLTVKERRAVKLTIHDIVSKHKIEVVS